MNKKDYINSLPSQIIDEEKVKRIEELYQCHISDDVKRIVSNCDDTLFFDDDDCRVLSFEEIIDAEQDLQVDFVKNHMIPLFDCFDNDFIVYRTDSHSWTMYNIVDQIDCQDADSYEELLLEKDGLCG